MPTRSPVLIAKRRLRTTCSAPEPWRKDTQRSLTSSSGSFADGVAGSGFIALPVDLHHAAVAGELPPHHRDPFDRMLVAQARVERLTLVSRDRRLEPYGAAIIWA